MQDLGAVRCCRVHRAGTQVALEGLVLGWSLASETLAALPGLTRPWFSLLRNVQEEVMKNVGS